MHDAEYECYFPETPLTERDLLIDWSFEYNRKCHQTFDKYIDDTWSNKKKQNSHIFNESKFRLHDIILQCKNQMTSDDFPVMKILLGLTCYKDFIGTNCSCYASDLAEDGIRDYNNSQAYMSDPLGVGVLVETLDKSILFIKRSKICAEAAELYDRPGGHPEPKRLLKGQLPTLTVIKSISSEDIVNEIFTSAVDELCNEVNIPADSLSVPQLLGFVKNKLTGKRPSAEFYIRCNLTNAEVKERYFKGTQSEAEESTDILCIDKFALAQPTTNSNQPLWNELTPAAKGAITLFNKFKLMQE